MQEIKIGKIFGVTLKLCFSDIWQAFKPALILIIFSGYFFVTRSTGNVLADIHSTISFFNGTYPEELRGYFFYSVIDWVVVLLLLPPLMVSWKRLIILGEPTKFFRLGKIEYLYFKKLIGLFLILFFVASITLIIVGGLAVLILGGTSNTGLAFMVVFLYAPFVMILLLPFLISITYRFALGLNAIAVGDEDISYRESWKITSNYKGKLFGVGWLIFLIMIPWAVLYFYNMDHLYGYNISYDLPYMTRLSYRLVPLSIYYIGATIVCFISFNLFAAFYKRLRTIDTL